MPKVPNDENIFNQTLIWICDKLDAANIAYMLTGGSALGFWGHIRTTMDIDILIQVSSQNILSFLQEIKKDVYVDIEEAKKAVRNRGMFNVILHKTSFKIDFILLNEENPYEKEKFKNRIKMDFQGKSLFVISPEDLIISKLLWSRVAGGSERQLKDAESIYRLNQQEIKIDYIKKWVKVLKLEDGFRKISSIK